MTTSQGPAFLELGERLRQRGQLAAAETVCLAGLARDPTVAAAHDLLGRIRADQGDDAGAIGAWHAALECDPGHLGARKGLAFVAFRARDYAGAEQQLERAAVQAPHDASVLAALDRIRALRGADADVTPSALTDPASGILLFDVRGLRLGGGDRESEADATAAEAGGLLREAIRATRLLQFGAFRHVVLETAETRAALMAVDDQSGMLVRRTSATPLGRLLALATRAVPAARAFVAGGSS
ncbi:MAG: hypothetical protein ACREL5_04100 [Gemmatimonadales bacterium]